MLKLCAISFKNKVKVVHDKHAIPPAVKEVDRFNEITGKQRWDDRVINRTLAHLKSFARWVHKWRPFELGEPMAKIRMVPVTSLLDIEKALTKSERRDLLDAANLLVVSGGLSRNRRLYNNDSNRQKRKGYREFRNSAIFYFFDRNGNASNCRGEIESG